MEKNKSIVILAIAVVIIISIVIICNIVNDENEYGVNWNLLKNNKEFNIISSSENQDLEDVIQDYALEKGYEVNIEYAGTLDIMQKLN